MEADDAYMPYYGTDVLERTMKCKQRFIDSVPAATDIVGTEWFEFRQAEFNLWSRTLSAASQGKSSLDYRLRYHDELRQLVCNLLDGLVEALDDVFKLNRSESPSDGSPENAGSDVESDVEMASIHSEDFLSESEDGTESTMDLSPENQSREDSVDIQKFYVTTTIAQLARLSTKIRESGAKYRYLKADAALNERDFEEPTRFWINDILGRRIRPDNSAGFPEITTGSEYLDESMLSTVQKRLVKANLLRLNRIEFVRKRRQIYQPTYSANQQQLLQQQPNMDLKQEDPSTTDPISTKDQHELQPQQQQQQQQQKNTIAPSVQYTATDVGSTIAAPSFTRLMEPSIVSRATRIGRRGDLEYPKCPKPQTDGASLVCPYCADLLPTQDILPYICFYEQCETPDLMYASSEELMKHVNRCHSQLLWVCTQCTTESMGTDSLTFTDLSSWEAHTCQNHSKVPTSAELALLADACQETIPHSVTCPLCTQSTDAHIAGDDDHILWHLHQFALSCLPWDKDEDDLKSVGDTDAISDQELIDNEELLDEGESIHGDWSSPKNRMLNTEEIYATYFLDAVFDSQHPSMILPGLRLNSQMPSGISDPLTDHESHGATSTAFETESGSISLDVGTPHQIMQSQISDPNVPFGYPTTPEKIVCETPSSTEDISMGDAQEPQHTKANKTNQVRSAGACITCRLQKVTCSAAYPCEYCKKAYPQKPEVCCIRHELSVVAQEIAFRRFDCFDRNEDIAIKKICRTAQLKFHDSLFVGRIFLDRDPTKFGLEVILRNYECSADDRTILHRGCTFSKDHDNQALTIKSLQNWVEQSTSSLELITFEGGIGYFIKICSTSLLPASLRPQIRTLLQKAHVFRCMFNILYCRDLFFLQANVEEPQQLPSPAQAEIRGVAKSAIESSERDIFAELDRFFKAHKFNEVERAIVWAVLWQLMLTYRGLLRNTKPWCNNAEPLLNAVAVFYASLFRTSASLKLSLDSIKLQNPAVAGAFNFALSLRDIFYKSIGAGDAEVDQRLNDLVVRREIKVLNRRLHKKAAAGQQSSALSHDDDLVMGG